MKLFLIATLSLFTFSATAETQCTNMAKYSALRAYHAEMGPVQGSQGPTYEAKLLDTTNSVLEFVVQIGENNEDGDSWVMTYKVLIDNIAKNCKKRLVQKINVQEFN